MSTKNQRLMKAIDAIRAREESKRPPVKKTKPEPEPVVEPVVEPEPEEVIE
jgi:hypothetical protein